MSNKTLKIVNCVAEFSPLEFCNLGTMACVHRRYNLGHENAKQDLINAIRKSKKYNEKLENNYDFSKISQLFEVANLLGDVFAVTLPLYLYDHSGITISTEPFSCPWDSGQVGFIYVTKEKVYEEYSVKRISRKTVELIERCLKSEVKTYDHFLTGNVYGFEIVDEDDDILDSCYGFFGTDFEKNGLIEYLPEEFKEEALNYAF